jgi:GNAT superfamily N-acetyltransferase
MKKTDFEISLSGIDEQRFGIRTAKASGLSDEDIPGMLTYCDENGVALLITRSSADDIATAQELERNGFLIMDTLVYYLFDFAKKSIPEDRGKVTIRMHEPGDEESVEMVAVDSFRGYTGHYHADPRLDDSRCDEVYTSWAHSSVASRDVADEVLVAVMEEEIVGFATLKFNSPDEGEGVLFGVAPKAQSKGIYRSFIIRALEWFHSRGAKQVVVSTQVNNIAVQKVWTRVGFEPCYSYYTFHKWFR